MLRQKKIKLIGRCEYVDFPELLLFQTEAKIDTGAYTTALHCDDISIKNISGKEILCIHLNGKEWQFEQFLQKNIKSSSGESELRYVIKSLIIIGEKKIRTAVSLTDRANMRYPVLIGRKLLRKKFVVDVSKIHTNGISFEN